MNRDLTVGEPDKVLIRFTIPLFISVIFQQLYSIADSAIAGKYAGENALAAIGASYPITMIFMAVAVGCQVGCSVVISRRFGSGNISETKTGISTAMISGAVLSALLTAAGVIFASPMMTLVNTPENIFAEGSLYLKIYTGGFMFVFIYNITTGIFNSLGDSRTPLIFLIISSVGNVLLDMLFIIKLRQGVAGAAWATFIAQGVSCVLSAAVLIRRLYSMHTEDTPKIFSADAFKDILRISIPSVLQQSFVSVGNMFVQYMVNGFGSSVIAGYSAAIKLNTFAITGFATLGNGVSSFTAQNLGAGKPERVKKAFRAGLVFALAVCAVFFAAYFVFGTVFLRMFMNEDSTALALDTGVRFLRIVSPFYFTVCTKLICDGVLRGSECMAHFMAATFTDLVMRVVLAFIFMHFFDETGIWLGWPLSWAAGSGMSLIFYLRGVWRRRQSD